jgi:hypothetical protein
MSSIHHNPSSAATHTTLINNFSTSTPAARREGEKKTTQVKYGGIFPN